MDFAQLVATVRKPEGKGAARRLRADGRIPAICYGGGMDAVSLAVSPLDLTKVLKGPHGRNTVIQLAVEGGSQLLVMVREFQRHPIARSLVHADFIQVKLDEELTVEVPLVCTGRPVGVQKGGNLNTVFRRVPVKCRPDAIPVEVTVDVSDLDIGDVITASKVQLPPGVSVALDPNQTVVSVTAPEKEPVAEEAAVVEGAVPAEGAAAAAGAAPAAGAAAPAAGGAEKKEGAAPAKKEKK